MRIRNTSEARKREKRSGTNDTQALTKISQLEGMEEKLTDTSDKRQQKCINFRVFRYTFLMVMERY